MKNIFYNKTKIIATIGPSSSDINILKEMIIAGVDVVRLNFSHGEKEFHKQIIKNARIISEELQVPICILQDLQGPKIRVGEILNNSIELKDNEDSTLINKQLQFVKQRIIKKIDSLKDYGFHKIVLAGHSAGAWASLTLKSKYPKKEEILFEKT